MDMRDNSNDAPTAEISLLTVCINSLVHVDFAVAPVDSPAQFTKSLNKTISDLKNDISWIDRMNSFLISDNCQKFVKADVEKARQNFNVDNLDDPVFEKQIVDPCSL
jgi:hypothetical protein